MSGLTETPKVNQYVIQYYSFSVTPLVSGGPRNNRQVQDVEGGVITGRDYK